MILVCGVIIQDMKWKTHIQGSEQSLVKQLTSRINGLVKVSLNASRETRLMVANGIFMSKLCYLIQLWGNCEKYLIKTLQVLQNKAARLVTGKSWFTSTRRLLKDCNWMSVQQLVFFHTVLQTHKILLSGTPTYFSQRISTQHPYKTRQAAGGSIWRGDEVTCKGNFSQRGSQAYNSIPPHIRNSGSLPTFKYKLRQWVTLNIPID